MTEKLFHKDITERILQSFFTVNKTLQYELSAVIYGNALAIEFEPNNLTATRNYSSELRYHDVKIGSLQADFLIEKKVFVKVVSTESIDKGIIEDIKLLLQTSGYEICMILNLLGDNEYKRIIFSNEYKRKRL